MPYYANSCALQLSPPTRYLPDITKAALQGLRRIYRPNLEYTKAGVLLSALDTPDSRQIELFSSNRDKKRILMDSVQELQHTYGQGIISCRQHTLTDSWRMQRKLLSPRYTTRWSELPRVS